MDYKGYEAVVNYDEEAKIYSGEVINTKDVITFQSESVAELEKAFQDSVDDYLVFYESRGVKAAKAFGSDLEILALLDEKMGLIKMHLNQSKRWEKNIIENTQFGKPGSWQKS